MRTIRSGTDDPRGTEGKWNEKKSERQINRERFLTLGNKRRAAGGARVQRWGDRVTGSKEGL